MTYDAFRVEVYRSMPGTIAEVGAVLAALGSPRSLSARIERDRTAEAQVRVQSGLIIQNEGKSSSPSLREQGSTLLIFENPQPIVGYPFNDPLYQNRIESVRASYPLEVQENNGGDTSVGIDLVIKGPKTVDYLYGDGSAAEINSQFMELGASDFFNIATVTQPGNRYGPPVVLRPFFDYAEKVCRMLKADNAVVLMAWDVLDHYTGKNKWGGTENRIGHDEKWRVLGLDEFLNTFPLISEQHTQP